MNEVHARDLDLNLLRVFVVVGATGSVTRAAAQLYLTQSAVSAALRRLQQAVREPLIVRQGRGIALTARGDELMRTARPLLLALVDATMHARPFDPATSERTFTIGLSDATEAWLLPPLVRALAREAPRMRLIVLPVQFRTVADALAARRVDVAITVADELPGGIRREALFTGDFVCVYDPRHARLRLPLRERDYFDHEHVIVSYNGDLRGIVEDALGKTRRARCSVPSFAILGALIVGGPLLATVPGVVAAELLARHPGLRQAPLPFTLPRSPLEIVWPAAMDSDPAARFLRERIVQLARAQAGGHGPRKLARNAR
jgi:LysR family transcriptional regulator, mexEF-oprN operon transcriptional activator